MKAEKVSHRYNKFGRKNEQGYLSVLCAFIVEKEIGGGGKNIVHAIVLGYFQIQQISLKFWLLNPYACIAYVGQTHF